MSDNKLYGELERSREAVWAYQENNRAIGELRQRLDAEAKMEANVAAISQKQGQA